MKKILSLFTALAMLPSINAMAAFPHTQWAVHVTNFTGSLPNKPSEGFKNLTFPIAIVSGPIERKFYYSQYVYFNNSSGGGAYYTGVQPKGNGQASIIFSFFGKGARVIDNVHCSGGADGGNGVSCAATVPFELGVEYHLTAELVKEGDHENVWEGSISTYGKSGRQKIGSWATPKTMGYLSGSSIGFIEDYTGIKSCADIPTTTARFGGGYYTGKTASEEVRGAITAPYGVGVCKGKVAFSSSVDGKGNRTIVQQKGVD
ncbi:DUF3472 domain-containing protein [Serratia marcescens]|uniref:DUF3472 domain-containing protein n=1 Tax=Serratia marcescens TaxID=615 RepID=UPI003FA6C8B5